MDYERALARIYENLEDGKVERATIGCLRVARATKDVVNAAAFARELFPDKKEIVRTLYDDISQLNPDARSFVFETADRRWLETHTLDFDLHIDEDGKRWNVLKVTIGEIDDELNQCEGRIADMAVPLGMGEFDPAWHGRI